MFFQRSKDTEVALEAFGVVVGNILFYEWLEDFEMFSIYEILPEILELWGDNLITQVDVKKKQAKSSREMTTALFLLRCVDGIWTC